MGKRSLGETPTGRSFSELTSEFPAVEERSKKSSPDESLLSTVTLVIGMVGIGLVGLAVVGGIIAVGVGFMGIAFTGEPWDGTVASFLYFFVGLCLFGILFMLISFFVEKVFGHAFDH